MSRAILRTYLTKPFSIICLKFKVSGTSYLTSSPSLQASRRQGSLEHVSKLSHSRDEGAGVFILQLSHHWLYDTPDDINWLVLWPWSGDWQKDNQQAESSHLAGKWSQLVPERWVQQDTGKTATVEPAGAFLNSWQRSQIKAALSFLSSLGKLRLWPQHMKETIRLKGTNCYNKLWQTEGRVFVCVPDRERERKGRVYSSGDP